MPKAKRIPINLRAVREEALISGNELASALGLAPLVIYNLELERGNPRLDSLLQIVAKLSDYLEQRPTEVMRKLLTEATFATVEDVYERASQLLSEPRQYRGNYAAKRLFLDKAREGPVSREEGEINLLRLKQLFARSPYSVADLSRVTGISPRALGTFFNINSSDTGNATLWTFLRLAAALAAARQSTTEETVYYLLEDALVDLERDYDKRKTSPRKRP